MTSRRGPHGCFAFLGLFLILVGAFPVVITFNIRAENDPIADVITFAIVIATPGLALILWYLIRFQLKPKEPPLEKPGFLDDR